MPKGLNSDRIRSLMEGVFALNKPAGISSAQAIRDIQSHFTPSTHFQPLLASQADRQSLNHRFDKNFHRARAKQRKLQVKIGHGGTLDPAATGVLILGVGAGTKSLLRFLSCSKTYECVALFGAATDSYDGEGKVVGKKEYAHVTRERVERMLREKFSGVFMQKPPVFSALNVDGKRAYEYAREGKELPRGLEAREVDVSDVKCVEWMEGGTHGYKWPAKVAPMEEKKVAEKLAGVEASPGGKRKRSTEEDFTVTTSKHARKTPSTSEAVENRARPNSDIEIDDQAEASSQVLVEEDRQPQQKTHIAEPSSLTMSGALLPDKGPPAARIRLTSSRGFYVRSLCHDLGLELGTYGIMASLVRVRQGEFALKGELERSQADQASDDVVVEAAGNEQSNDAGKTEGTEEDRKREDEGMEGSKKASKDVARWDVLEYEELEKGEAVWAPRVKSMFERWNRAQS